MQNQNVSEVFGPRKISFSEIGINTMGAFISGIIGALVIFVLIFISSSVIDVSGSFNKAAAGMSTSPLFPFALSMIAFIGSSVAIFSTYFFMTKTDGSKYKSLGIIYGQLSFFIILTYILLTPVYIYAGVANYDNIIYIFLFHVIVLVFGTHLIAEMLNNYRYLILGFYASFVGFFASILISLLIFSNFSSGFAKLIALLFILPIVNTLIIFIKQIFEKLYYVYYNYTGLDQLGDIQNQIKSEEDEEFRTAELLNN